MDARFHVTFETPAIAPLTLPPFPYQAVGLSFDRVTYSALVEAESIVSALMVLGALWPTAQVSAIEQVTDQVFASGSFKPPVLGALLPPPPAPRRRGILMRFWVYIAGEGPFFKN